VRATLLILLLGAAGPIAPGPAEPPSTATPTSTPLRPELLLGAGEPPPPPVLRPQPFPEPYATVDGVLTFRGGPRRDGGAAGERRVRLGRLEVAWRFRTGPGTPRWGGGAGWTGQPALVRWPAVVRHSMPALGRRRFQDGLVEVIQGSLDGNVYFLDLATGRPTRPPIRTGNPVKGSVAVDPRGYPLLVVGQGVPGERPLGLRLYSLVDGAELFFLPGRDPSAPRAWGAFDSSALVNRATDTLLVGGENGLVYLVELGTAFDPLAPRLTLSPRVVRYRFRDPAGRPGIEGSLAAHDRLAFFADNGGTVQALDLITFRPAWSTPAGDDTDASLTVDVEGGQPVLYAASEVDAQGIEGVARLRRLDGRTGAVRWTRELGCRGTPAGGGLRRVEAGAFATNAVGRGDVAGLVFFTLSRCPSAGLLLALDAATGLERWRRPLPADAWSSPTLVPDAVSGRTYLLQGTRDGRLLLVDARDGRLLSRVRLDGAVEASPAVYDDVAVVGTRGGTIYGIRIR
jgi:outer membrane protein assembly factor BamB